MNNRRLQKHKMSHLEKWHQPIIHYMCPAEKTFCVQTPHTKQLIITFILWI